MRNGIYLICCASLLLCLSACKRYTTTRAVTSDTIYVHKVDSVKVKPDTIAIEKVKTEIETVFMEVEKDCPNLPKEKSNNLKKRTLEACTMQSLSGGKQIFESPDLRAKLTVFYDGNNSKGYWDIQQERIKQEIEDKTVEELSFFRKVLDTWPFWAFPWAFFFLWLFLRFKR